MTGSLITVADIGRRVRVTTGRTFAPHPLVECAIASGAEITVADVWPAGDRALRRVFRGRGSLARICPICLSAAEEDTELVSVPP